MSAIRKLPTPDGGRVETGPVQFGDDWPGTFIRGDNGMYYAMEIRSLLAAIDLGGKELIAWHRSHVESLASLLEGALVKPEAAQ